jgi:hypothetical protein
LKIFVFVYMGTRLAHLSEILLNLWSPNRSLHDCFKRQSKENLSPYFSFDWSAVMHVNTNLFSFCRLFDFFHCVLFRLWTKVKIFLVFVKLELPYVFLLPNPMKMTLKGALKFFIRLAEETFVIHVRDACILFVTLHSRTF